MRTCRGVVAVAVGVVAGGLLTATEATADDERPALVWQRPAGQTTVPDLEGYTRFGDELLFTVRTEDDSRVVMSTDGTAARTRRTDIEPEWLGRTALGDRRIYFRSDDAHGAEPWVSDGTAAGTYMLRDIRSGSRGSSPSDPVLFQGRVYFSASDDAHGEAIWATDGTREGTVLVVDPDPGPDGRAKPVAAGGRTLFLSASGAEVDGVGTDMELWASDGSAAGSRFVADLRPGGDPSYLSADEAIVIDDAGTDRLYAAATDEEHGRELWTSDGTAVGTRRVIDLAPGTRSSDPDGLYSWRGQVLFFAEADRFSQRSLWRTDGTAGGTVRLSDLHGVVTGDAPSGFRPDSTGGSDRLLLTAADGTGGRTLWQTDATPAGTSQVVLPVPPRSRVGVVGTWRSRLVLGVGSGPHGAAPWISDLTVAGTYPLAQEPEPNAWNQMTVLGDRVLWRYKQPDVKDQLYSLDLRAATARSTTVRIEPGRATYGQATVRVHVTGPPGATPAGDVTLRTSTGVVGTGRLRDGLAEVPLSTSLLPGTHVVTATYDGTSGLAGSTTTTQLVLTRAAARVTATVRDRLRSDRRHRLRVTVVSPGARTTGTYTIRAGRRVLARGTARSISSTTVRLPRLRAGRHRLVVTWSGSSTTEPVRVVRTVRVLRR